MMYLNIGFVGSPSPLANGAGPGRRKHARWVRARGAESMHFNGGCAPGAQKVCIFTVGARNSTTCMTADSENNT